ncbi:MAG: Zn-ribbon domain-containing OB-fold protein [Dehalococcoidia bacterium]|tara:strand:+ start:4269 stop:4664 length:396 start_codon:yes stop_codon:yes gene_type:complete
MDSADFFEHLKENKLIGVQCNACGELSAEIRYYCSACQGSDLSEKQFSGKGKLSTFTCISIVPTRMAEEGFGRDKPYCSGIVTLDEGPRISARILNVDASNPASIESGQDLELDVQLRDSERPILSFRYLG